MNAVEVLGRNWNRVARLLVALTSLLTLAYAQRLAPGDRIRIICEEEPTLSVERVLSPLGNVTMPLIGEVSLGGKFLVEAESELERLASAKLGSDRILIAVALMTDESGPVEFSGAVNRNGSVMFRSGMSLADVVKLAEPTSAAATDAVEIVSANGKKLVVDITRDGDKTRLRPGDRIFFPLGETTKDVLILGGVAHPGSKACTPGLTLRELVALAGGATGHGQTDQVRLERKGEKPKVMNLNSTDAETLIERGDVVVVPLVDGGRFVTVGGFVPHVGLVEFHPGMTLGEAIKDAGGVGAFGATDSVVVRRLGMWKRTFDSVKDAKFELRADDTIEVPMVRPKTHAAKVQPGKMGGHPVVPPR